MEISIYSASGGLLYSATRTKNSKRFERIMGDNYVQLVFNEVQYIPFRAGCYIIHNGEKLRLYKNYFPENTASGQYKYDIKFHNFVEGFKTEPLFNYILKEDGTYAIEPEVQLTDTLNGFGRWIVMCINKSLGLNIEYIENPVEDIETEVIAAKSISFSEGSILDGIQSIASTFETEYWFDGNKFHLSRCERDDLEVLTLGENYGLRDGGIVFNDDEDPIPTKIFAYGGERNIVPKFNSEGIAYDKRLMLPDGVEYVEFEGAEVEVKIKKFYDDIYPRKVFKISSVRIMEATTEEEIDTYYIKLADMDFDPSAQIIEGLEPAIAFQSGRLIGRDFDVEWKPKAQEFKIVATAEGDYDIPQGQLVPIAGDMVILYNIEMPEQYKLDAQKELQEVAQKDVDMMNRTVQDISLKSDKYNWAEQGRSIALGQKVKLLHNRYSSGYVTSRCKELSYPLDSEYDVEFTIGDAVDGGTLASIKENINDAVELIEQNRQQTIGVSRRGWRSSQELLEMYNGISAEVAVIAKGPEAQFSTSCVFTPNYQSSNTLKVTLGTLKHAIYVDNAANGVWAISSGTLTQAYDAYGNYNALNADLPYYVYARCSKSNDTGAIVLYAQEMAVESIDGYYLFPVGALSSVIDGSRVFNTMYGYTQINGGSVTTGVIKSLDGQTYIDLDGNKVRMGDADQSIDWNVTANKRITLHNVSVLSDSGDVSNIGVYRGQYNAEYLYYKGDEVSFYNDGFSCTYRYASDTPTKGIEPTNTSYWELLAKGKDGQDGTSIKVSSIQYQAGASAITPPSGDWNDDVVAVVDGQYLWTKTTFSDGNIAYGVAKQGEQGQQGIPGTDGKDGQDGADGGDGSAGEYFEYRYAKNGSTTEPPALDTTSKEPDGWSTIVPEVGELEYLWLTIAKKSAIVDGEIFRLPISDTDTSAIEDTTNDYDGIITDNVSLVTATEGERCAVDLGGNANCRIPYDLPFGTSFTLCLWIRPAQSSLTWMLSGKEYTDTVEDSFAVSAGSWHHLAFRFSGRSVAIFKDGAQVQSGAVKGDVIGFALYDNDVLGLQTLYDDIRLLNKALSADDVAKVMSGAADELVSNWSTPIRISPKDGAKGDQGYSPALVFRGNYSSTTIYYGNSNRVDAVYLPGTNAYYVARVDAGAFKGVVPAYTLDNGVIINTAKWNAFGAQFESIATNLLLAENANIADWIIKDGKITSQGTTSDGTATAQLDGETGGLKLVSDVIKYTDTMGSKSIKQTINIDSELGVVEARTSDYDVARLESQGIYANRAGQDAYTLSSGISLKGAIVGSGEGAMDKDYWGFNFGIAGVIGLAFNESSNPAPAYGGYFHNLMAAGLILNPKYISDSDSTIYLDSSTPFVLSFCSNSKTVYLPSSPYEGQVVFLKQLNGGTLNIYPYSGQKLYDDASENTYYQAAAGQSVIAIACSAVISSVSYVVWIVNRIKF